MYQPDQNGGDLKDSGYRVDTNEEKHTDEVEDLTKSCLLIVFLPSQLTYRQLL